MSQTPARRALPRTAVCVGAMALLALTAGCGGGGASQATTPPSVSPPASVTGISAPGQISVVTANNAS